MIDMTKSVTITSTGIEIMAQGDHPGQLFEYGRVLLLRKDRCVVAVHAGVGAGKKVDMPLTFPATIDGTIYHADVPDSPASVPPVLKLKLPRVVGGETKIGRCRALYSEMHLTLTREQMVARFVSDIGCTPAGAVTYYLTCAKG